MNNDRGRVHLNERRMARGVDYGSEPGRVVHPITGRALYDDELPDAPENPDFVELFSEEQANAIAFRFLRGMELGALYDARATRLAREASLACHARFHKPRRPDRKQRNLTAKLGDVARPPRGR